MSGHFDDTDGAEMVLPLPWSERLRAHLKTALTNFFQEVADEANAAPSLAAHSDKPKVQIGPLDV